MDCDVQNRFERLQSGHGHILVHDRATPANGFKVSAFWTSLDKIRHVPSRCAWRAAFETIEFMKLAFGLCFVSGFTKSFQARSKD